MAGIDGCDVRGTHNENTRRGCKHCSKRCKRKSEHAVRDAAIWLARQDLICGYCKKPLNAEVKPGGQGRRIANRHIGSPPIGNVSMHGMVTRLIRTGAPGR